MPDIGGSASVSTGRVAQHATRPAQSRSSEGANRIGGAATVSTARVAQSVKRAAAASARGVSPVKLGGTANISTGRVAQHVGRPADGPGAYEGGS